MNIAEKKSGGIWKPSPGLIYPLLGRMLDEDLIEEGIGGKYQITRKGKSTADDLESINDTVKKQLDVLFRVGNVGRFVAMDLLERISSLGAILSSNVSNMTKEETAKYKKFLESELKKIEKQPRSKPGKKININ